MRILILYNVARDVKKGTTADLVCEQEIVIIVPLIVAALSARGHRVSTLEATFELWENLKIYKPNIDLVFNLAEAFGGGNKDEPLIPAMLEALEIPFTGASAHNMYLTLDKEKTKLMARGYGIPVPEYQLFRAITDLRRQDLNFPLIVKPIREEASIGIHADSVVNNEADLHRKVDEILSCYRQPALVESFIAGREISVGVVGNTGSLHVFPPLEFLFTESNLPHQAIRSYEYKWGGRKEQMVRGNLPKHVVRLLLEYTERAFVAAECRDYARMDYRVTDDGSIYLLEVNYNPGIGPNTHGLNNTLTIMASFQGYSFEQLIEWIISTAACRDSRKE